MNYSPVVSAEWLNTHLQDPQIVIIDCRFSLMYPNLGREQYQQNHIQGAHYLYLNLDLSSPVQRHGGRHPLPDFPQLATKLAHIGITSQQTMVVAYDDSRFAFASSSDISAFALLCFSFISRALSACSCAIFALASACSFSALN